MLFLALGDAEVPDARYFAFWWNIGLDFTVTNIHDTMLIPYLKVLMISVHILFPPAHDGSLYVFRYDKVWRLTTWALQAGYPVLADEVYNRLPHSVGAAVYSDKTRYTYFFKGQCMSIKSSLYNAILLRIVLNRYNNDSMIISICSGSNSGILKMGVG